MRGNGQTMWMKAQCALGGEVVHGAGGGEKQARGSVSSTASNCKLRKPPKVA